jgi:hypothetical protein
MRFLYFIKNQLGVGSINKETKIKMVNSQPLPILRQASAYF